MSRRKIDNIKTFSVVLDKTDYEKMFLLSRAKQVSISAILRGLIREYLENQEKGIVSKFLDTLKH